MGPWSGTPLLFNNSYFVLLKGLQWTPNDDAAKFQYKAGFDAQQSKSKHSRSYTITTFYRRLTITRLHRVSPSAMDAPYGPRVYTVLNTSARVYSLTRDDRVYSSTGAARVVR